MPLILGKDAIANSIQDALLDIHSAPLGVEQSDGTFVFTERDDGTNTHALFKAAISTGNTDFSDTIIRLISNNLSVGDLRKFAKKFFELYGECTIIVP